MALSALERQGSFAIDEKDGVACRRPRIGRVVVAGPVTWLGGTFDDADPVCRDLSFTVGLCEPRDGHLTIDARV